VFWVLDYLCLALILAAAGLVVALRNLNGAVMALSAVGTVLSVLFVVLGAPDVAHSEIAVGAIALPVLFLVAIGKSRTDVADERHLGEEGERHASSDRGSGSREGGERIGAQ
jgi:energy-converting hydrogenase B subunit D